MANGHRRENLRLLCVPPLSSLNLSIFVSPFNILYCLHPNGLRPSIIDFNPFSENWFENPPKIHFQPINLLSSLVKLHSKTPNFASMPKPFFKKHQTDTPNEKPRKYRQMLDQFYWECENLPDYRHTPEVEKILNDDPVFEKKENPSPEELEENEKWWGEFRANPVVQFLTRAEEIADELNEIELQENSTPYKEDDNKLWQEFQTSY